jgi:sugar lactone lactonase YvrE
MVRSLFTLLMLVTAIGTPSRAQYAVTLAAGRPGLSGTLDGTPDQARFNQPRGIAVHPGSGQVFVVDQGNTIRRFTPGVGVDTFAGSTSPGASDGIGTAASFNRPEGLAIDSAGTLYIADTQNHLIRRITSAGEVSTLAGRQGIAGAFDGSGSEAEFNQPRAIAIGPGGTLLVADSGNHTIRRISIQGSGAVTVTTLAGQPGLPGSRNGTGTGSTNAPKFNNPQGIVVDGTGVVFVADTGNNTIRRISPTGVTTTFAGSPSESGFADGKGSRARFSQPFGITIDPTDGTLHVTDQAGSTLRRLNRSAEVRTVAGLPGVSGASNGIGSAVRLFNPRGVSADSAGNLFIADGSNHTLRRAYIPGRLPAITTHPKGQTLAAGKAASFTVRAVGPEPLLYQWRRNGIPIPGATTRTHLIPSVASTDQGHYDVVIENPWGLTTSQPAPLVMTDQSAFLWATRIGTSADDAALDLAVQPTPGSSSPEQLWLAALNRGQAVSRHSIARGKRLSNNLLDKKGVGLHAIAVDTDGNQFLGGQSVLVNNGRPAVIFKRSPSGRILWSRQLATERGGRFSPASNALVHSIAIDSNGAILACGYFQGSGKFGENELGNTNATVNRSFLCKLAANGEVLWAREIFSSPALGSGLSAAESLAWSLTLDENDAVYLSGVCGPHIWLQNAAPTASAADYSIHTNTYAATPWVAKYDATGTLSWAHIAAHPGHFFSCRIDPQQQLWVTGVNGDRIDALQQSAVLQRHNTTLGLIEQQLTLPAGKGSSIDVSSSHGIAWLVMDPAGLLDYEDRQLGVPGYRVIGLESDDLSPRWDHPILGALSLNPLSHSEQADLRFGQNGTVYLAVNFQAPEQLDAAVEFCGRTRFPLKNRRSDGFLAALGELPRFSAGPQHQLAPLDQPLTLSVTASGFLSPRYQWLRNGKPMRNQTSTSLTLTGSFKDAASYSVQLSNGINRITTPVAQVAIIDVAGPGTVFGSPGGRATLSVQTAGRNLLYEWNRTPEGLPPGRVSNANKSSLIINSLIFPDDQGNYTCTITGPGGNTLTTAPRTLLPAP